MKKKYTKMQKNIGKEHKNTANYRRMQNKIQKGTENVEIYKNTANCRKNTKIQTRNTYASPRRQCITGRAFVHSTVPSSFRLELALALVLALFVKAPSSN